MLSTDSFAKVNEFVKYEARIVLKSVLITRDNIVVSFCDINNMVTLKLHFDIS